MSRRKTVFSGLFVMLLWGSLFPMIKIGYKAYSITSTGDILFFAGVRFAICGLIISLYSLIKNRDSFENAKHKLKLIALSGLFAIVLHYSFTYMGLKLTDSSKTAIIKQVGVCFYVCFSWMFFKDDKLTLKKLAGVLLGFSGIAAINSMRYDSYLRIWKYYVTEPHLTKDIWNWKPKSVRRAVCGKTARTVL